MNKNWITRTLGILAATAILTSSVGCGGGTSSTATKTTASASASDTVSSEAFDPMAKYATPITITTVGRTNQGEIYKDGESVENNAWTKLLATYGINVKYLWTADASQYDTKLNLSIASGEVPDIAKYNSMGYTSLLKAGLAQDLSETYDKYATPLTKELMKDGNFGIECGKVDGKLMSIPVVDPAINQPQVLWIRNDLLKKYNLQIPKTIDDLMKVQETFVKNGMMGLGIAGKDNFLSDWGGLIGYFYGFGVNPSRYFGTLQDYVKDSSGNIVWSGTQPGVKAALQKLQDMYKAGYLAKDFSTWDSGGKLAEAITSGKCGMFYGQWWLPMWPIPDSMRKNPGADWIPVSPPSVDGSPAASTINFPASFFYAVGKDCKNPEAAIKAVNLLLEKQWGPESTKEDYETYISNPEGSKNAGKGNSRALITLQAPAEPQRYYTDLTAAVKNNDPSKLNTAEKSMFDAIAAWKANPSDPKTYDTGFANYRIYADPDNGYFKLVNGMKDSGKLVNNMYQYVPSDNMSAKLPTLIKMQEEIMMKIIYGSAPVSEYDKFLESWKKLGGDDVTKEVSDWVAKNPQK
ncbi:MAG TPA: hypothetical protein VHP38_16025 [Ruminiclostridium sp.]|nr:hypothetical protein [Ruminiclostridium sp.]